MQYPPSFFIIIITLSSLYHHPIITYHHVIITLSSRYHHFITLSSQIKDGLFAAQDKRRLTEQLETLIKEVREEEASESDFHEDDVEEQESTDPLLPEVTLALGFLDEVAIGELSHFELLRTWIQDLFAEREQLLRSEHDRTFAAPDTTSVCAGCVFVFFFKKKRCLVCWLVKGALPSPFVPSSVPIS